jgi:CRP/FNR family transcriptional regulator, cyclic AMP receptor protein
MAQDTIKLTGSVKKLIDRSLVRESQQAQISLSGADFLYDELRVHNWEITEDCFEPHDYDRLHALGLVFMRAIRTSVKNNSKTKSTQEPAFNAQDLGQEDKPQKLIPTISQEMLAEMVGTTRPRVNFFMNKFRKLEFIKYNGGLHIDTSPLSVALHDQQPGSW